MKRRQNIPLLVIGALGVIIISGYFIFQFLGDSSRLRNYTHPQYGFSIKYPVSWKYEENKGDELPVIFISGIENDLDIFKENVSVVVQNLSDTPMNLEEYTELAIKQMEVVFKESIEIVDSSPTNLSRRPAHQFIFLAKNPDVDLKYMSVWTVDGLTAYQITFTSTADDFDQFVEPFKKMIQSFKIR